MNDGNAHDISDPEMAPPYKYHLKTSSGEPQKLICIRRNTTIQISIRNYGYSTLTRLNSKGLFSEEQAPLEDEILFIITVYLVSTSD